MKKERTINVTQEVWYKLMGDKLRTGEKTIDGVIRLLYKKAGKLSA